MNGALWFVAGALVATALVTRIKSANTSTCCQRVALGARGKIGGYAGPLAPLAEGALDGLGLTDHLPGLLDTLGVPLDA